LKPLTPQIFQLGITFSLFVEADIEIIQMPNRILVQLCLIAPTFVGLNQLAKLRAPVAQIINPHHIISQCLVDARESSTNDRRAQMPDTKRLGDIGRRIFHDNCFAFAVITFAVVTMLSINIATHIGNKCTAIQKKIEIGPGRAHLSYYCSITREACGQFRGNVFWIFSQMLGQLKARKRKIPHLGIGRHFDQGSDLIQRQLGASSMNGRCNMRFKNVHMPSLVNFTVARQEFLRRIVASFHKGESWSRLLSVARLLQRSRKR
jgi:hypothetical protein